MKRFFIFISIPVISAMLLSACGFKKEPISTAAPTATATAAPEPTEATDAVPEPTPDPRDSEEAIRAEIEQKFVDIEDLIAEDMIDDAKMMIENLKTFDLNEAEQKRLDEIQKSLVSISD